MINKPLNFFNIFWRGMCMGLADLVPGISGGTIALLLGIYERFLSSLSGFSSFNYKLFWQIRLKASLTLFWQKIDGFFLLALLSGIVSAIILFANILKYLFENHEVVLLAFFMGLMLATSLILLRRLKFQYRANWLIFFVGIFSAFSLTYMPFKLGYSLFDFYLAGLIASCFMLLPGVSGSFMLLILGIYPNLISAVHYFDIKILAIFALGIAMGFLFFSRLLHKLLNKWHNSTMVLLTGFVVGSLPNLWPWQAIRAYAIIDGKIKILSKDFLSPLAFEYIHGNSYLFFALSFIALGFLLTLYLNKLGNKNGI